MKILLLNDCAEKVGGAETYLYNLKNLLEKKSHVKTYFSNDKVKLRILGSIFSIKNLIKSYSKIKKFNPDIVHVHKYNLSLSVSPLIAAKIMKKKTIVTFHDFGLLCANGWCVDRKGKPCNNPTSIKWVFKKSLSNKKLINRLYDYVKNKIHIFLMKGLVDIYIGPSKAITMYLKKIFTNKKVKHLPYFITDVWAFRNKKKINKKLLFVGRLEKEKGLEYLIKALRYLNSDISLDIIGEGTEKKKMQELIKILNLKNKINFIGKLSNKDIQKYYHNSDILIMPSIWVEQFGIIGLEALACGTPVIASDVGGVRDWIDDKKNGFLVEPRNPKQIAQKVNEMLKKNNVIRKFAKSSSKKILRNFNSKVHMKKIEKIYNKKR